MRIPSLRLALLSGLLVLLPPLGAQSPTLSLREALGRATSDAYSNRVAGSLHEAARARAAATGRGVLPSVRGELGAIRTDDPLGAFGFLLRQRAVTPAAFDPAGLNRPAARTDVGTAVIGEIPLLNLDAWSGRRAALRAAEAEGARADWTAATVQLEVVQGYLGAVLARERAAVLAAAVAAAHAHLRQAESALRNGVVTPSDVLLAQVRLGDLETQQRSADLEAWVARRRLALLLGAPGDSAFALPGILPDVPDDGLVADLPTIERRGDVQAASLDAAAATAAATSRGAALLPRVNAFGRYEWHDPTAPLGGRPMWTVGVMASWSPFSGGAELAARREARASADAARTGREALEAGARLEAVAAERALAVARLAVASTTRGAAQAVEAHRIVARKYEGGLATVAELLDAQATALGADLAASRARHDLLLALATLRHVRGADLMPLAAQLDAAMSTPE